MFKSVFGGFVPSGTGSDPSLEARVTALEDAPLKVTYFEIISGAVTSGTITPPANATIQLNQFASSVDAILSTIDGSNRPTFQSPLGGSGEYAFVTSLDTYGNYTISEETVDASIAIIYVYSIPRKFLDVSYSIGFEETNIFTNEDRESLQNAFKNGGNSFSTDAYLGTSLGATFIDLYLISNGTNIAKFSNAFGLKQTEIYGAFNVSSASASEPFQVNIAGTISMVSGSGSAFTLTSQGQFALNSVGNNNIDFYPDLPGTGTGRVIFNTKDARYAGDYSAQYASRSLIDKGYADGRYALIASPTFTGQATFAAGSSTTPSIAFTGSSTNTGIHAQSANQIAVVISGTNRLTISSTGVGIAGGFTATAASTISASSAGSTFTGLDISNTASHATNNYAGLSLTVRNSSVSTRPVNINYRLTNTTSLSEIGELVFQLYNSGTLSNIYTFAGNGFVMTSGLAASSGSSAFSAITLNPVYNQTGTASGTLRGIYYNPTTTGVLGTHNAIETTSGNILFGGSGVSLSVAADTDNTNTLGRARIYAGVTDNATFAHIDCANNTDFGLRQSSVGGVTINFKTGAQIIFAGNNTALGTWNASGLALFGAGSFGGATGALFIANGSVIATTNPTGGGILYAEGGALKWRGSAGTVTVVAPA